MNTLEEHVLSMIGENTTTPDVFTDDDAGMAQIRGSINDAIEEVSMLTGSHQRVFTVAMASGCNFYRLALTRGHFCWPVACWDRQNKRTLDQVDPIWLARNEPRWLYGSGNPNRYGIIGRDILVVHPAPSSSTNVLEMTAVCIPSRYTSDDEQIKLRDTYRWAVTHFAVSEYWASRGDAQTATTHHGKYLEGLKMASMYQETPDRPWTKATEKKT